MSTMTSSLTDKFIGSLELDHNGYYITGSTELDALLASAVKSVVKDSMTQAAEAACGV